MISTDERSPSGRDSSTTRLNINNNNIENSPYYQQHQNHQYIPSSQIPISITTTPPLPQPTSPNHQIILRDLAAPVITTAVAVPDNNINSSPTNAITDFIHHHLSSRIIPKLGSIVKRFSLNYSGEGLVTDRQRTRTVRVGIRFQVQVDSFERPRTILRTQSTPAIEQLDSGFSSPTADVFGNSPQLALEYKGNSAAASTVNCSEGDSSSGVSSEAGSPVLGRRHSSATLSFHNRINKALDSYRNQLVTPTPGAAAGSPPGNESSLNRRSSIQVYRRGSTTPERANSIAEEEHQNMEDCSSYQVLRHFPGSNVHSLNELNWETAAFEKEIRDRIQWLGDKITSIRAPRVISQLIDFGRDYARENPVTALILLALCLTSLAPVLIFLVFAVATILVTFLGFLFVEGTVLTVATVIFGGVILIVGFITLTAILIGMLGYFTTNQAYLVVTGKSKIFRLIRKLPLIRRFFPNPPTKNTETPSVIDHDNVQLQSSSTSSPSANGKISNGYGPHHGNHYVHHDNDDLEDILDSDDDDDEDDIEVDDHDLGSNSDLGENEQDLGNQENISEVHKSENKTVSPEVVMMNGHHEDETNESENAEALAQSD
ncbi:unnamed protein product [Orchesella dallaii]|uniref:Promethin n=1 Tax=Orchesella dallaii TaxID=48710 RepID=A0ABP1S418_9HEXA